MMHFEGSCISASPLLIASTQNHLTVELNTLNVVVRGSQLATRGAASAAIYAAHALTYVHTTVVICAATTMTMGLICARQVF